MCVGSIMEARLGIGSCSVKMFFFMQVRFLSTPFLLSELYRSAPMHAACLHTATDYTRGQMMCSGRLYTLRGVIP